MHLDSALQLASVLCSVQDRVGGACGGVWGLVAVEGPFTGPRFGGVRSVPGGRRAPLSRCVAVGDGGDGGGGDDNNGGGTMRWFCVAMGVEVEWVGVEM